MRVPKATATETATGFWTKLLEHCERLMDYVGKSPFQAAAPAPRTAADGPRR
ncbi:MAG: hypothetical protein USCAAHI_01533 [Beijerinckiaceae bacterium]|nr:MAG: hypothetical protein USCAAHI_01533 [Beijerinckiaceae bacterium]